MAEKSATLSSAYVPWSTFQSAVERFATEGLPGRIDRSLFPNLSGAVQYQLIAALKFLGLLTENDEPSEKLREMSVQDESVRKEVIRKVFEQSYSDLFALDLMKATPAQLNEKIADSYGLKGTTRTKAVRFFLAGIKYLEIEVAPILTVGVKPPSTVNSGKRRKRKRKGRNSDTTPPPSPPGASSNQSRTVELLSGGSVTLSIDFDPFTVTDRDRDYVLGLVDQLRKYEKKPDGGENDVGVNE